MSNVPKQEVENKAIELESEIVIQNEKLRWWQYIYRIAVQIIIPVIIVFCAIKVSKKLASGRKKQEKRQRPKRVTMVKFTKVARTDKQVIIAAMGTVIPARQVELQARVSGEVVSISDNFEVGAKLKKGEMLVKLDDEDYRLLIEVKKTMLAKVQADLQLEKGQQAVARHEWKMVNGNDKMVADDNNALALRIPQYKKLQATLQAVETELKMARLKLQRTKIIAPFNAIVAKRAVDVGAQVAPQTHLATLIGSDQFWIEVTVPVERLVWISVPGLNGTKASEVVVEYDNGVCRGRVLRLLSQLEVRGRMARLLVVVDKPLELKNEAGKITPLLLGSYVNVKIKGKTLHNIIEIPRNALHEGNKVWLTTNKRELIIRDVEVAWKNEKIILIKSGLEASEMLITSNIMMPLPRMKLLLPGDKPKMAKGKGNKAKNGSATMKRGKNKKSANKLNDNTRKNKSLK